MRGIGEREIEERKKKIKQNYKRRPEEKCRQRNDYSKVKNFVHKTLHNK